MVLSVPLNESAKARLRVSVAAWLHSAGVDDSDASLVDYVVLLAALPRYAIVFARPRGLVQTASRTIYRSQHLTRLTSLPSASQAQERNVVRVERLSRGSH